MTNGEGAFGLDLGIDEIRTIVAIVAISVSLLSLIITLREKKKQRHAALISALQGEKEAVAFISFQLRNHRWGKSRSDRLELLSALVVAWIFEKSDRARAMIHSALETVYETHRMDVEGTIEDIKKQLESYVTKHYSDKNERDERVGGYLRKLGRLQSALMVEGNCAGH